MKAEAASYGDPKENRTPDSALRGRRLDRLTIGPGVSFGKSDYISNVHLYASTTEALL